MMLLIPQQPLQCGRRSGCLPRKQFISLTSQNLRRVSCSATLPIDTAARLLHPTAPNKDESPAEESPRFDVESDIRYRRADMSDIFAYDAKQSFARLLLRGEPGLALAEAALQVTAEDDALVSHSTVRFPVESYLQRIDRMAGECALRLTQAGCHAQQAQQDQRMKAAMQGVHSNSSPASTESAERSSSHNQDGSRSGGSSRDQHAEADRRRSGAEASTSGGSDVHPPSPQRVLDVVAEYLLVEQRFKVTQHGRSNLPPMSVVDHPGVWEDAQHGYLHTLLVRRTGHPAMVALLFAELMRRLLSKGAVDFAITMAPGSFEGLPRAVVIPGMTRQQLLVSNYRPSGTSSTTAPISCSSNSGSSSSSSSSSPTKSSGNSSGDHSSSKGNSSSMSAFSSPKGSTQREVDADPEVLNTCTSEVLVEALRHLKRAYWPFQWDSSVDAYAEGGKGSHGGFRAAAKIASGEAMSETIRAISQVASWRLQRGIWTSPGAGDIRRAVAACERLVMMIGDEVPEERRDLAVLLVHNGDIGGARAELRAYMRTAAFVNADPFDRLLCQKLSALLAVAENVTEPPDVVSIASVLRRLPPDADDGVRLPLTW